MKTEVRIYNAINEESFYALGSHILATKVEGTYTFHPGENAITLAAPITVVNDIGRFIDAEGLDFHIDVVPDVTSVDLDAIYNPLSASHTLKGIIEVMLSEQRLATEKHNNVIADYCNTCNDLKAAIEAEKKNTEKFQKYWIDETQESSRVKQQVEAITVLMKAIYPS